MHIRPGTAGARRPLRSADRAAPHPAVAALLATMATMLAVLPGFLVGAMATFLRADVDLTTSRLGVAVAVFFGGALLASVPGGRLSERGGPERALAVAALGAAASLLLTGAVVRSFPALLAVLALGGLANGVVHPAANLMLVRHVPLRFRGRAFGIKQSSIVLATLAAGLAVPTVALTVGWRWTFSAMGVLALLVAAAAARLPHSGRASRPGVPLRTGDLTIGPMVGLAVVTALGAGTAVAMGSFLVDFVTTRGLSPSGAGLLLALASSVAVPMRIGTGWLADRWSRHLLPAVSVMMGLGAIGLLAIGTGPVPLLVLGALVGFGVGWGWHGLLTLAVVHANPNAPAAATAIFEAGSFAGCVLMPIVFGAVAAARSYPASWLLGAAAMALAAVLVLFLSRVTSRLPR